MRQGGIFNGLSALGISGMGEDVPTPYALCVDNLMKGQGMTYGDAYFFCTGYKLPGVATPVADKNNVNTADAMDLCTSACYAGYKSKGMTLDTCRKVCGGTATPEDIAKDVGQVTGPAGSCSSKAAISFVQGALKVKQTGTWDKASDDALKRSGKDFTDFATLCTPPAPKYTAPKASTPAPTPALPPFTTGGGSNIAGGGSGSTGFFSNPLMVVGLGAALIGGILLVAAKKKKDKKALKSNRRRRH